MSEMKYVIILILAFWTLILQTKAQTVTDKDGNIYNTVTIGTQVWMRENLKTTHYNNGDVIHKAINAAEWSSYIGYCNYDFNDNNATQFGHLYDWFVVTDNKGICPAGFHVPSEDEFLTLINFLGGLYVAGGKMKTIGTLEGGTGFWWSPNTGATNSSGFTAKPGGRCYCDGTFSTINQAALFWTTTQWTDTKARTMTLWYNSAIGQTSWEYICFGQSVRCIKDIATSITDTKINSELRIFPNPATEKITIKFEKEQYGTISLYSLTGELLLQKELTNNTEEINISFLLKGIYLIKIDSANDSFWFKLIKE